MARVAPLDRTTLTAFEDRFRAMEEAGNVVPNSMLTMGRVPGFLEAYLAFSGVVFGAGEVPADLKRLVAHISSRAGGCQYCATHNGARAGLLGVDEAKLAEIWSFESSPAFSPAERAALRLGVEAAQRPNEVTEGTFTALGEHFSEAGVVELLAVVAMAGFTNRWNDTVATDLEPALATAVRYQ